MESAAQVHFLEVTEFHFTFNSLPSLTQIFTAQSAEAAEYTDSLKGKTPEYDTKQSDGKDPVMLWLWGMWSVLHCHHSQVHSSLEW